MTTVHLYYISPDIIINHRYTGVEKKSRDDIKGIICTLDVIRQGLLGMLEEAKE